MQMFSCYFNVNIVILPKFFHDGFSQHENGMKVFILMFWSFIFLII